MFVHTDSNTKILSKSTRPHVCALQISIEREAEYFICVALGCTRIYRKGTFLCARNLCEFVKMGLLINLCDFYLCILYSALCIVMYGTIKFMRYKFMQPTPDSHNSHKSRVEICHFRVLISQAWLSSN